MHTKVTWKNLQCTQADIVVAEGGGMVQMGGGLPALPPKPPVPQRQPTTSTSSVINPLRVPIVNQAVVPQLSIPSGSDLGAVGKIGVYQLAHTSSSNNTQLFFWIYLFTAFLFIFLIKR